MSTSSLTQTASPRHAPPAGPAVLVVAGNPRPGSRTTALASALGAAIADLVGGTEGDLLDLAQLTEDLGPSLGSGSAERWAAPLAAVHAADILVIATPVYKGSYTGLLKSFLDHVGTGALDGITAVPVITVGSPAHTLAADVHLRPLLIELGASTPTTALVAGNDVLGDPAAGIATWVQRNERTLRRATGSTPKSLQQSLEQSATTVLT